KSEQGKDAGRPRISRYGADRGRRHAKLCSRPGTQRDLRMRPLNLEGDEFVLDTPRVRTLVADVRRAIADGSVDDVRSPFEALLADREWLPDRYMQPVAESGMSGGIGQWLLFRAHDRALSLFSLVVPPGEMTPVHDHLAWGFVGVYRGTQDEELYRPGE